ncbi:MAG TPA: hypothetical protein VG733_09055, partial [Chthoniobacteraceae bacterium]|nr:hypothetical protein [Chthoniobacteraceae bacterium]
MTDIYEYGFFQQLASRIRKSPVKEIRRCLAVAREHDIGISAMELEAHHLAGVHIGELMDALVLAQK